MEAMVQAQMQAAIENNVLQVAQAMEDQLDNQIHRCAPPPPRPAPRPARAPQLATPGTG